MRLGRQYSDPRRAGKPGRQPVDRGRTPPSGSAGIGFLLGAVVSLATSWSSCPGWSGWRAVRIVRGATGNRCCIAADAPEITASITALSQHEKAIGAECDRLKCLQPGSPFGLGAVAAGFIPSIGGWCCSRAVGLWVAVLCMAQSRAAESSGEPWRRLVAIIPYLVVLGVAGSRLELLPGPKRAKRWIISAVNEEELELEVAIRPTRGRPIDRSCLGRSWSWWRPASPWRGASTLGHHFHVADVVSVHRTGRSNEPAPMPSPPCTSPG